VFDKLKTEKVLKERRPVLTSITYRFVIGQEVIDSVVYRPESITDKLTASRIALIQDTGI
jgi:hypothetical protein